MLICHISNGQYGVCPTPYGVISFSPELDEAKLGPIRKTKIRSSAMVNDLFMPYKSILLIW